MKCSTQRRIATADTITSRDLRVASVALLTRGEMPDDLGTVPPSAPLTDHRLAKRFLAYAADSITAQPSLWQGRDLDADVTAGRLRRVPAKEACATCERLLQASMEAEEHLLAICEEALDDEPGT